MNAIPTSSRDPDPQLIDGPLELEGPFWRFALDFYAKPGVAAALLRLQDEADVDVIHALLTVYACIRGSALSADDLAAARRAMVDWRAATVLPLRRIRRELKSPKPDPASEMLRTEVKKAELLAEQIQIAMAERWLRGRKSSSGLPLRPGLALIVDQYSGRDCRNEPTLSAAIDTIADATHNLST